MTSITAAGNTYNPCLLVLQKKGFELRAEELDNGSLWCASKDGRKFSGYSPPELLGIVAMWESLGDDWNQQRPDLLGELLENAAE